MSIDLGDIDKIDFRESIRRKLSQNGLKHQRSNRAEMAWGGSLRNLVVQQSFIRVRKKSLNKIRNLKKNLKNVEETLDTCSNLIRFAL